MANIHPKHLTFCNGFVKIFVPRSKTDVYGEGNSVYIAKLENKYCPVAILCRYIEAANLDLSSHLPSFRPLTKNKSGYTLRNGKLSYTRFREIFKTTLKDLGFLSQSNKTLQHFQILASLVNRALFPWSLWKLSSRDDFMSAFMHQQ